MKVLSTAGEPLGGPFASVIQEGSFLEVKASYRKFGVKHDVKIMLDDEAFKLVAAAMIQAMNVPEFSE